MSASAARSTRCERAIRVTSTPSAESTCAISTATTPEPRIAREAGSASTRMIVSEVCGARSASPSIGGRTGREPAPSTMVSAVIRCRLPSLPSTSSSFSPTKRAVPRSRVRFALSSWSRR